MSPGPGSRVALLMVLALLAAASIGTPAAAAQAPDPRGVDPASPNPLAGLRFYVDHNSPAWRAWQTYTRRGQKKKARLVRRIAREPRSTWLEASTGPNPGFEARRRIDAAKAVGAIPVFVVLRAETKRCSRTYQGGGAAADRATRSWYEALARGIGGDRVVIAFEPDSLESHYRRSLHELLEAKRSGEPIPEPQPVPEATPSADLLEALRASIAVAKKPSAKKPAAKKPAPTRARASKKN